MLLTMLIGACGHIPMADPSLADAPATPPQNFNIQDPEPLPESIAEGSDRADGATQPPSATEPQTEGAETLPPTENDQATTENSTAAEGLQADKKTQPALDEALELCQLSQDYWQKGELENAVDALDQAYALILNVDTADEPKLIQQKEDLRYMISKRILEIYASRNIVVNGNHNAIPVVTNKHVQAEIDSFTSGRERSFFIDAYQRSGRYRPQIVAALQAAGLPEELSWLPLIESGYKVKALSRSRALGLWQFIPSTGYKFGLSRDKFIDERMDPHKATMAAIEYLKELHAIFGDWSTALAAYNCGEGRVLQVIRTQNINYLDNFWDLYERLPRETARYVPRFLATLHIVSHLGRYGLDQIAVDNPPAYEEVTVAKQIHLKHVADNTTASLTELQELNPELRYAILPGENYSLRVPPGSGDTLLARLDEIPVSSPPERAFVYHRVRSGETLSTIARRHRTSVNGIMRANNLRRSNYIVAGKLLKIPKKGWVSTPPQKAVYTPGSGVEHVVRKGDSLWIIAKKYGTTTKRIQDLNHLTSSDLHIGQTLVISPKAGAPARAEAGRSKGSESTTVYEVRPGDNAFVIAKKHNMSLERLLDINRLDTRTTIYPGQKLTIE